MDEKHLVIIIMFMAVIAAVFLVTLAYANGFILRTTNAVTRNETGALQSTFQREDVVIVEATVEYPAGGYYYYYYYSNQPLSFLFIVKIDDPDGLTIYYGVVYAKLKPGESGTYAVGALIPKDAKTGTYTAYIYCWNTWPSMAGNGKKWIAYSEEKTVNFVVVP